MSDDKQPMQASGDDGREGADDGVENPNGQGGAKGGDGQSNGGAYPNAKGPGTKKTGGFFGHGGQTDIDYSGTGAKGDEGSGNANAVTGS